MAGGTHHLSFPQVENSATRLNKEKEDIESRLIQLKSMIDQLVASDFVTERASGKFQQDYDQWNNGARQVMQGLEGMSQFLKTAIAKHRELDASLSGGAGA
ncbi:WXG100 family type VII secretion target [Nonomuraea sp. NPDC050404]|uniref:WXG100 family type VII secretion target n=1 Tax=Nonomuraea sp. NPDC050404 TaxID=3155783 RepID=UPI0033C50B43